MGVYDQLLSVQYAYVGNENSAGYVTEGPGTIEGIKACIQGKDIVVGLDQATNKTGCCFMDFNTRQVLAVMDIINLGFPSKFMYFQAVYDFLANHIEDEHIVHFVYEIPVEHSPNMNIRKVLESMRLFIRDFGKRMPSLSKMNMVEINIQTWRSHFLKDPCYKGLRRQREDAKLAARAEAIKRCPDLADYLSRTNEPLDSCDAVGIAYGALEEIYSSVDPKLRRPNKTMPKTNAKTHYEIHALTVDQLMELLQTRFSVYIPEYFELLEFNPEMSVEENCKRYSCSTGCLGIIPITDRKTCQELKWETGQELQPGQNYYALSWR